MKKLRPVGQITADLEVHLLELAYGHELQWHEILSLVHGWLMVHHPSGQEVYDSDGSSPVFQYGPPAVNTKK